jgi:hypothetical protein
MKEELIKFETAKLAKEKGFDIPCENFYYTEIFNTKKVRKTEELQKVHDKKYLAPTQSLLQKWLRDNFKYHVQVIRDYNGWSYQVWEFSKGNKLVKGGSCEMPDYHKELEKGLQEALKLVENNYE